MSDPEIIIEQLINDVILEQAPSIPVEIETIFTQVFVEVDETVVVIESVGAQGPPGPPANSMTIQLVSGMSLSGHRAVTRDPAGAIVYASNDDSVNLNTPVWLSLNAADIGEAVNVLMFGFAEEPSWSWTPDAPLYLGQNGVVTQIPPVAPAIFLTQIGYAISPTTVFIDQGPSIQLS